MNLLEYAAKAILAKYGVKVTKGILMRAGEKISLGELQRFTTGPIVVKAQIDAGGRGKGHFIEELLPGKGGVIFSKTAEESLKNANSMLGATLVTNQTGEEGQKVKSVYFQEAVDIKKEYYLCLIQNKDKIKVIASAEGGVDIEETAQHSPEKIISCDIDIDRGLQDYHCIYISSKLGLDKTKSGHLKQLLYDLYKAYIATDATQIEINPLVESGADDGFIVLDTKMKVDDNSLYRQQQVITQEIQDESYYEELEKEASGYGLSYVRMKGNIGCMVNGAGLAMATMDSIKYDGGEPANFLDVGGGADQERVAQAFKIILSDPRVKAILVNIFGGIMKCDVIARGIVDAAKSTNISVPVVVRLSGTNFDLGKKILEESGLNLVSAGDLGEATKKVVQLVKNS